jgi:hypothetical protein
VVLDLVDCAAVRADPQVAPLAVARFGDEQVLDRVEVVQAVPQPVVVAGGFVDHDQAVPGV